MHGNREGQTYLHASAVGAHGIIDKLLQLGKGHNRVKPLRHLTARESGDHTIDVNVLATRQVVVEPSAETEQPTDPPAYLHMPCIGASNTANEPQQRRLPSSISANHPHHTTGRNAEAHIVQRPEVLCQPPTAEAM